MPSRREGVESRPRSLALVATLHDPEARLLAALRRIAPRLAAYDGVFVAVSNATDPRLSAALGAEGVAVTPGTSGFIGEARRGALGAAAAADLGSILYCDFDRWLFWAEHYPDELASLPARLTRRRPRLWYACLGRTPRAFATHPRVQRIAEGATNRALSAAIGRRIDATAGACWLSREGAEIVLRESVEHTNATDLEWPALIHRVDPRRLGALTVDGLAFETASFYPDEVAAAGGESTWMSAQYERPEVWLARLRLATDSVAALCRVLG